MIPGTLQELFTFNDWAMDRLLDSAAERTDAELDQPYEMGEGSLRRTVVHLWEAEGIWLERWRDVSETIDSDQVLSMAAVREHCIALRRERETWLSQQSGAWTEGSFSYARPPHLPPGPRMELRYDASMLHILNHGVHHRAQAINMIKRLGAKPPTLDYIVMRLDGTVPSLDAYTLQRYLWHGDWAYARLRQAAALLPEEALDKEFPIGPGTVRRILRHLADAPRFWVENIRHGPGAPFPTIRESHSLDTLLSDYEAAARDRDQCLDGADLKAPISVTARGAERTFPLGVAMLQLCCHGTHHRAQAINMLRHLGIQVAPMDVAPWVRQGAPVLV